MPARKTLLACLLAIALGAAPASADSVIFSNLGPDGSYNHGIALWFGFDTGEEGSPDYRFARAVPFVAGAAGRLTMLEMALAFTHSFDEPGSLVVNIYEAAGTIPGTLLESFSRADPYTGQALLGFPSLAGPLLTAGSTYFVEATTTSRTDGLWFVSPDAPPHLDVWRVDNGPWRQSGAFLEYAGAMRVSADAAPVPEPATLILLGSGLAATALRGRRRRRRT